MDPSHGDSRYNLNYSMSSIGLRLADQVDMYGNPAAVSASAGLLQSMSGGEPSGGPAPCTSGNIMSSAQQCQSMGNSSGNHGKAPQQRGIKRAGSDCYEEAHHSRGLGSGISSIQGLDNFSGSSNAQHSAQQQQQQSQQQHQQSQQQHQQQQPQSSASGVSHVVNDNALQRKKSPPANGKKTKGRVKIKMEYIDNKLRRYTTFSKRKTGIMKKAYELSTLTGTQVMLLVASETGHVYTFATRKLQPMITSEAGKQLIQTCLNSPDPPSVGGGDQRMSATGFEETELSYNIADEDSKEPRSPLSSMNDSEDSSDLEGVGVINNSAEMSLIDNNLETENKLFKNKNDPVSITAVKNIQQDALQQNNDKTPNTTKVNVSNKNVSNHPTSNLSNVPQEMLLQLIEAGHLQVHTEEDGSGHQYVAIPLHPSTVDMLHSKKSPTHATLAHPVAETIKNTINLTTQTYLSSQNQTTPAMIIKQEISE